MTARQRGKEGKNMESKRQSIEWYENMLNDVKKLRDELEDFPELYMIENRIYHKLLDTLTDMLLTH